MGTMTAEPQDISLRKESFDKTVSYGEPQTIDEWQLVFSENEDLQYLCRTAALPEMTRERIEDFGPLGVQFGWPGRPKNLQEMSVSFLEVKKGVLYDVLEELVREKTLFDMTLKLLPNGKEKRYESCFIETCENLDLEYEGNTVARPTATIVINWGSPWNKG